jgi:ABC-type polysaccharide/polyol phosphate export permease
MINKTIKELYLYRDVLLRLVKQQLTLRYRRTALGYLWTLINPLLMMSVMALVFSSIYKSDVKEFSIFLFAGMIPWNYFSSVVTQSGSAFINNEGLIKKIYLPKAVFPLSISIALLIDSLLSFCALFLIILVLGGSIGWETLFLPIAFFLLFVFSVGIGLLMSVATVFFRDLQHITIIALQGLFFLTPILYKNDSISGKVKFLVDLNPVVPFIQLFRAPLYLEKFPDLATIAQAAGISGASIFIGWYVFFRAEKNIVFRL